MQATWCATLVDEWIALGVRHAVIAPGSRSTPMAVALASRAELRVELVHDERSAGFVALGIGLASGMPAIVLCTSGTAATHFHAAVVESHQSCVPLLVLTADRPPELRDVGAPQTIDQRDLYGGITRWSHDPGVPGAATSSTWRSLAGRAVASSLGRDPGPVHLNLPFREPLVGSALAVPPGRSARHSPGHMLVGDDTIDDLAAIVAGRRGVLVAGKGVDDVAAVGDLAGALGWPIFADPRSGCRSLPAAVRAFDAVIRHAKVAADAPEVVLRLGEPPASKVLGDWLAACGAVQVQVDATSRVIDPHHVVTARVVGAVGDLCRRLSMACARRQSAGGEWGARWTVLATAADAAIDAELRAEARLTEPAIARLLTGEAMDGCHLVVASSMPIRDVEWFGGSCTGLTVHANRGANGIDGELATAIGVAVATGAPTAVLLGDTALCHDASSLTALAGRGLDLTIVVLDNDGGGIFSFLPQASAYAGERFEQLFGAPHGTDLVALAAAHGVAARDADTEDDVLAAISTTGTSLVRVTTDRAENVDLHRRLNDAVATALDDVT